MALQVQQRLPRDVADLVPLPRVDPHVVRVVAEALDVVELTFSVDRGPGIPQLPVVRDLVRVVAHASARFFARALMASITQRCASIAVSSDWS